MYVLLLVDCVLPYIRSCVDLLVRFIFLPCLCNIFVVIFDYSLDVEYLNEGIVLN